MPHPPLEAPDPTAPLAPQLRGRPGLTQAVGAPGGRRELVEVAKGRRYPSSSLPPMPADTTDAEAQAGVYSIIHPHLISPVVVKYAQHALLAGALQQIVGAHLPHWDGSVKVMQTQLFAKPPGFQGQAWHQARHPPSTAPNCAA